MISRAYDTEAFDLAANNYRAGYSSASCRWIEMDLLGRDGRAIKHEVQACLKGNR